ncbi:hypothetical protein AZI11_14060 (plasmid) [Levilactobacillus brevis]|nr:hypothetical protein AZI11_14060 [Levilactobacillus brevis]ARN96632.1 hypothetical protein AZI12_14260 [Levilactobacillus brevis]
MSNNQLKEVTAVIFRVFDVIPGHLFLKDCTLKFFFSVVQVDYIFKANHFCYGTYLIFFNSKKDSKQYNCG